MITLSNPAFNYEQNGHTYAGHRRTDERIARYVREALDGAKTVLNIGAGAGSYEPVDKYVMAVEPSSVMRRQRLANGRVPAIDARAENLPFDDHSFDASMAMITVHHWPDIQKGLRELRRVTRNQVLIMTFDPAALYEFWNAEYFPELVAIEQARYPAIKIVTNALGGRCEVLPIPIPLDCVDGFQEAFYGRPEEFLDRDVRRAQSAWGFLEEGMEAVLVQRLADELASGEWDVKFGHHRTQLCWTGALRLIVATP